MTTPGLAMTRRDCVGVAGLRTQRLDGIVGERGLAIATSAYGIGLISRQLGC
jgi:hypothetical protein